MGALGTIPDKYDVAVSTACPSLHNNVVETVEQGQACIEYLRRQNLGRASFMVLDKLTRMSGMDKMQTPENVPRLFDLIKPKDAKFAPAFFKAVGNTLVADNLEQANRIAYGAKRWRVVTLTGQLIDTSGTMSGGGSHVSRGAMSSKLAADSVPPELLRQYEQESENAARASDAAQAAVQRLESELEGHRRAAPDMDFQLRKMEMEINTLSSRIGESEKRLREMK